MRHFDADDAKELNAEQWQIDLLMMNPSYVCWGPHEDYMWNEKDGWDGRIIVPTWAEFGPWNLDELNECVNFYFSVERASEECKTCGGNGYVNTAPAAHVSLTLWWLHPRKGCSRGIEIARVEQSDLPAIYQFLRQAAKRNADRFSKVPNKEQA